MKILLTGGAGFIGSHLAEYLLASGHEVDVVDDLSAGKKANVPGGATFFFARCQDLTPYWREYDFVYHLASTVGVSRVTSDPAKCIANVVDSTRAVLALKSKGIYFSTSEVYGKNQAALGEDSDCVLSGKARWNYAAAKLCGEWMALQAGWKVVRLFNVIGPRQNMDYGAVFPNFLSQAQANEPITVYGQGYQVRTFIDVRDCVEILDQLRDKQFDVVNVGGSAVMSILDLARLMKLLTQSRSEIRFTDYPMPEGFEECHTRVPDLSRLNRLIRDFKYRALKDTVEVCQSNLVT